MKLVHIYYRRSVTGLMIGVFVHYRQHRISLGIHIHGPVASFFKFYLWVRFVLLNFVVYLF